jgi:hypothetical protein
MQATARLGVPALVLACATFAGSAYASLETDASYYSALPKDDVALNEYTGTVACTPARPHYVPSFIRTADGTIIGVGYIEVQNANATEC